MNWTLIVAIAAPSLTAVLGLIGIIITAQKSHRAGMATAAAAMEQAKAAKTQAEAALEAARAAARTAEATAQEAINDTFAKAYKANDEHWAIYNEGMQKWNESLSKEIAENTRRIEGAEGRAIAAEARAARAEQRYQTALIYLKHVFSWVTEHWPGEKLPPLPAELEADLDEYWKRLTGIPGEAG